MDYQKQYIITQSFEFEDQQFVKDDFINFVYSYEDHEAQASIYVFSDDSGWEQIHIPQKIVEGHIENYLSFYQKQFSHLDKNPVYFGQIRVNDNFFLDDDSQHAYMRIGEYQTSDGNIYNAVKMNKDKRDFYWSFDDEKDYANREFLYLNADTKTANERNFFNSDVFIPPESLVVPEFIVDFPQMLEVIDHFFNHQTLSPELNKVYSNFSQEYRYQQEVGNYEYVSITKIPQLIQDKENEQQRVAIMKEIDKETEAFRQSLIKKRFK